MKKKKVVGIVYHFIMMQMKLLSERKEEMLEVLTKLEWTRAIPENLNTLEQKFRELGTIPL